MKTEQPISISDLTTAQSVKNLQFGSSKDHQFSSSTKKFHQQMHLSLFSSCFHHYYKYFNALILFISAICNCMVGVSFATINHQVSQYYDVTTSMVSFCALITFIINPIVSIFANYILDNKGLKLGVSINCVLVILGVSFRMLINQSFIFVIIGNALNAMGNVFIINCPPRFSSVWFKPRQRIIMTSLIGFANSVSGQIGAIMAPYFVSEGLTPEEGRQNIQTLVNFQAFLIGSVMLFNLMFFRGIPSKPPKMGKQHKKPNFFTQDQYSSSASSSSKSIQQISTKLLDSQITQQIKSSVRSASLRPSQKKPKKSKRYMYINQLKTLFTTKNYLVMLMSFVCVTSVLCCFALNIQLYIIPFGFTSSDAGTLTLCSVATGLLGTILSSLIIKKLKRFKSIIIIQLLLSIIFSVGFIFSLIYQNIICLYISVCLFTMILYPLFPAMIQYSCQFMYPIRESTVGGILVASGQLFSFGVGMVQTKLLEEKNQENAVISLAINVGCYVIAVIGIFFTKEELKRLHQNTLKQ